MIYNDIMCFYLVLELDKNNVKAIGRKTKVLCSLGRFIEAHHVAGDWRRKDPHVSVGVCGCVYMLIDKQI